MDTIDTIWPTKYKTYRGKSANQILEGATVSVMEAGNAAITHPDFPGCILQRDDYGELVIHDSFGDSIVVIGGPRAHEKLDALHIECEAKQVEILRAEDARDGTTYAEGLGEGATTGIMAEWQNCDREISTDAGAIPVTQLVDYDWLDSNRDESVADAVMYHWDGVTRAQALDAIQYAREIRAAMTEGDNDATNS